MTRTKPKPPASSLRVEELEPRLVLSSVPLVQQSFDSTASGALPSGWTQWSSGGGAFAVSSARAVSGSGSLATSGASNTSSRAWVTSPQPADVQVSASVFVDGIVPAQLILRGSGLDGAAPTYYALTVRRGLSVELSRVVKGASASLGQQASAAWFSGSWAQLTLSATGGHLQAQVYRADTRQYLNAQGQWQAAQAWAIDVSDSAIGGAGDAGIGRAAGYSGNVYFDDFTVTANAPAQVGGQAESFDGTAAGALPSGWSKWDSGASSFAVSGARSLSGAGALASTADSQSSGRAWLASSQPADVEASAAVFADGLAPAQVLVRGSNLNGAAPTYYAVSVTRGLSLQLVRVVNGTPAPLANVASASWFQGQWAQVTLSASGSKLTVQVYRPDTGQYLDAQGRWQATATAAITYTDTAITGGGYAGLARASGYSGTVYFDNFSVAPLSTTPPDGTQPGVPSIPQHYSWVRLAQLAYSGATLGSFEDQLLRNSIDLVVTDVSSLSDHINQVAPNTPQMAYINYSSLYGGLLLDWLAYADAHGLSRESAFYHVTQATPFSGDSPSSQPVNWFWAAYLGGSTPDFQDVTSQAHAAGDYPITLGGAGQSLYLAYPEKFRALNFNLSSGAASGWSPALEYPTAVDAYGNPTAWGTLQTLTDSTAKLAHSGQIIFDPPSNWKAASINDSAPMYYVRVRTVAGGRAPVVNTVLGRDYTNANGGTAGVIPVFDYSADANHDGYLSDAEFANRQPGMNARFAYEGRLFYASYGQERFATNPSAAGFRAWAVDYSARFLAARPNTAGLFVDNSSGNSLVASPVRESVATYTADYGSLLAAVGRAVAPHWLLANTVSGGTAADPVVQNTAYFEEFALRPLAASYLQFEDTAALVAHRAALQSPPPYAVLDSLPAGGSPTDPRTQLATLAYYYLLADPSRTFLDLYGGYSPASSWSQHWFGALTYNVGKPKGSWSLFASGVDPGDGRLTYRVYARSYDNALVLYKPLSSTATASATGSLSNDTATVQQLGGTYRPLQADGTLGAPVTSVTLRNGEGAILIKA